jgi:uncharacterized protein YbjT (DUF2867 family)
MQTTGMRRLLLVSAAVLFEDAGTITNLLRRTLLRNVAEDSAEMERVIIASGLDWTIARPPKLTNGPLTRRYLVENGRLPRGKWFLSRADLAHFLLAEIRDGAHTRQIVGIASTGAA